MAEADVVLSVLASGAATEAVLLDPATLAGLRPGAVVCDLATSGIETAELLAERLSAAGVRFVDAPVSGSVPTVVSGPLLVMASGDEGAVAALEPVLTSFAKRVVRVGPAGAGQAMKLAVNLVVHGLNAAVSEALVLATRARGSRRLPPTTCSATASSRRRSSSTSGRRSWTPPRRSP